MPPLRRSSRASSSAAAAPHPPPLSLAPPPRARRSVALAPPASPPSSQAAGRQMSSSLACADCAKSERVDAVARCKAPTCRRCCYLVNHASFSSICSTHAASLPAAVKRSVDAEVALRNADPAVDEEISLLEPRSLPMAGQLRALHERISNMQSMNDLLRAQNASLSSPSLSPNTRLITPPPTPPRADADLYRSSALRLSTVQAQEIARFVQMPVSSIPFNHFTSLTSAASPLQSPHPVSLGAALSSQLSALLSPESQAQRALDSVTKTGRTFKSDSELLVAVETVIDNLSSEPTVRLADGSLRPITVADTRALHKLNKDVRDVLSARGLLFANAYFACLIQVLVSTGIPSHWYLPGTHVDTVVPCCCITATKQTEITAFQPRSQQPPFAPRVSLAASVSSVQLFCRNHPDATRHTTAQCSLERRKDNNRKAPQKRNPKNANA